jgi:hypothetical protein
MQWIKLFLLLTLVSVWAWNSEAQTSGGGPFTHSIVVGFRFQDINATGSSENIYDYGGNSLTRTSGIVNITAANIGGVVLL